MWVRESETRLQHRGSLWGTTEGVAKGANPFNTTHSQSALGQTTKGSMKTWNFHRRPHECPSRSQHRGTTFQWQGRAQWTCALICLLLTYGFCVDHGTTSKVPSNLIPRHSLMLWEQLPLHSEMQLQGRAFLLPRGRRKTFRNTCRTALG